MQEEAEATGEAKADDSGESFEKKQADPESKPSDGKKRQKHRDRLKTTTVKNGGATPVWGRPVVGEDGVAQPDGRGETRIVSLAAAPHSVKVSVWDKDRFSDDDLIGHFNLELGPHLLGISLMLGLASGCAEALLYFVTLKRWLKNNSKGIDCVQRPESGENVDLSRFTAIRALKVAKQS